MVKWLIDRFKKPISYSVVFWSRGFMSEVVVLHRVVVTAKNESDAYHSAISADVDSFVRAANRKSQYRLKWYAYKLESD